ncbi:hypothetical protein NIES2111_52890 [Nostoc sp. NIES-2111]|nr:hypothetical protein NIES2111_52890 [Nostoc sp. NIES-2111]
MRLIDSIILTSVSTVICIALPKLLSVILNKNKTQNNLPKQFATESAGSNISNNVDVYAENGGWEVGSRELGNKGDVALASSGIREQKK